MARAEIITMAKNAADAWRGTDTYHQAAQIIDMLVSELEGEPTLTPPNEWVSVEERLPEESDGMVLFTNGKAVTSGYRNHMFRMSGEEGIYAPAIRKGGGYMRVTHWMPLPAPPEKEEQK